MTVQCPDDYECLCIAVCQTHLVCHMKACVCEMCHAWYVVWCVVVCHMHVHVHVRVVCCVA